MSVQRLNDSLVMMIMVTAAAVGCCSSCPSASCYNPHWALYPRTYVAPRIPFRSLTVDGNLDKAPWNNSHVPWSTPFQDIQGPDAPNDNDDYRGNRNPKKGVLIEIPVTRFKAVWDEEYLYIAATLKPAPGLATQAHFTERNSPIFQRDSDFEVFVDATGGTTHTYKELEINALNTVWNLMLDKPYGADGGQEHSGRIAKPGDALYWDVSNQRTAVRVLEGHLNDPENKEGAWWTVEMALSMRDLLSRCDPSDAILPSKNSFWRINFSRVEKQGDINWTWQSQIVWDPALRRHVGKIAMHLPDAWGYLVFGKDLVDQQQNDILPPRDHTWPHRLSAMNVYYALHYYKDQHNGVFTNNLKDLSLDSDIVDPFDIEIESTDCTFMVTVRGRIDSVVVTVRHDRLVRVISNGAMPLSSRSEAITTAD